MADNRALGVGLALFGGLAALAFVGLRRRVAGPFEDQIAEARSLAALEEVRLRFEDYYLKGRITENRYLGLYDLYIARRVELGR